MDANAAEVSIRFFLKIMRQRLEEAASIAKGSGVPNKEKVGKVTAAQVEEVVRLKMADLNARGVEHAKRMVEGTARSMGLVIEG